MSTNRIHYVKREEEDSRIASGYRKAERMMAAGLRLRRYFSSTTRDLVLDKSERAPDQTR
ncbi:MAG TPA: hypothetical protein VJ812_01550 [Gemmatimonadaceae bacterium]|jgi:hypothetical protein|nr:hypothetical protein [Gemmatimonadaceae bacterium]